MALAYLREHTDVRREVKFSEPGFRGEFGVAYREWLDAEDDVEVHSSQRGALFGPLKDTMVDYNAVNPESKPQMRAPDPAFSLKAQIAHGRSQRLIDVFYAEIIKPDSDPKVLLTMVANIVRDPAGLDAWKSDSKFLQILSMLETRIIEKLRRSFSIDIEAEDKIAKDVEQTLERDRGYLYSALQKLLYPVVEIIRSFKSPDARIADKQARVLELIERLRMAKGCITNARD